MAGPYTQIPGGDSLGPPSNSAGASLNTYASQFTTGASKNFVNNIMTWNGRPASPRTHFFKFLEKWETTLPLQSLWMIFFDIPPAVQDAAMKYYGELHMNQSWGVNDAKRRLTIDGAGSFNESYGCTFAQTVGIPAEQMGVDPLGQGNRGFLKMPIVSQRQAFPALSIEFLETSLSFNDFLLRPWIILASHMGLVKRYNPLERITTDMFVLNLTRAGTQFEFGDKGTIENQRGFLARKLWLFKDCVPVNVGAERYSYTPGGDIDRRDTEWSYRKYQVMTPPAFPTTFDEIERVQMDEAETFWTEHKNRTPTGNPVGVIGTDGAGDVDYKTGHSLKPDRSNSKTAAKTEANNYWGGNYPTQNYEVREKRAKRVAKKYWRDNKVPNVTYPVGVIGTGGAGGVDYKTGHDLEGTGQPAGTIGTGGAGDVDYKTGHSLKPDKRATTKPKYKTGHDLKK